MWKSIFCNSKSLWKSIFCNSRCCSVHRTVFLKKLMVDKPLMKERCSLLRDLAVTLLVASVVVFGVWHQPANPPWQYVEHKTIQRAKVTICYQRVSLTCQCFIAPSLELNEKRGSSRKCACFISAGLQLGPLNIPCFNHRSTPWRAGTCRILALTIP